MPSAGDVHGVHWTTPSSERKSPSDRASKGRSPSDVT